MTLLPVDYKVMAKVLTIWLWGVMALVVSDVQTCGVDGRPCGLPLALLSLDQEKAFNRVSHRLFFLVLQRMGFRQGFLNWFHLLYTGAESRVGLMGFIPGLWLRLGGGGGCPAGVPPLLHMLMMLPSF